MRLLVGLLLVLTGCGSAAEPAFTEVTFVTPQGAVTIRAEVARTPEELARGLMFREALPADHGMLFVFEGTQPRRFFMKDTLIPLDLVSISGHRVAGVQQMEPCRSEPCPVTTTPPAEAALEINAGRAAALGLAPGVGVRSEALS